MCKSDLEEAALIDVCARCRATLVPWQGPCCARCGLPFASERALDAAQAFCADCRGEEFAFDAARSFGLYTGALRACILLFKSAGRERFGKWLGERMAPTWDQLAGHENAAELLLIPVPLHSSRKRERRYNQAELLAKGLARGVARMGAGPQVRIETRLLTKTRATQPQTGLSRHARRENVRGAFAVEQAGKVRGRTVVLADDVMTTGATLSACAAALKGAGAEKVLAITLARATPQFPDVDAAGAVDVPVAEGG